MATQTEAASVELDPADYRHLWFELMQFYIDEAWILDERRFHDWLDLFTEDTFYFVPRRKNVYRKDIAREITKYGDLAIMEESKTDLQMRVARLDTGMAWAEDPPSRTRHVVGNLKVEPLENGDVRTKTAFLLHKSHLETDQDMYAGSREDILRNVDGEWKIASRTVILDANVLMTKNISVFF